MAGQYAQKTDVPVERSRNEIEKTLRRYGADQFMYGWERGCAMVAFRADGRHIRMAVPVPDAADPEIAKTPAGQRRSDAQIEAAARQAERQRWRALLLNIKAKLEAVASGISTFENEFMAHVVLPDGSTISEWAGPQIEESYRSGAMPKLLPGPR